MCVCTCTCTSANLRYLGMYLYQPSYQTPVRLGVPALRSLSPFSSPFSSPTTKSSRPSTTTPTRLPSTTENWKCFSLLTLSILGIFCYFDLFCAMLSRVLKFVSLFSFICFSTGFHRDVGGARALVQYSKVTVQNSTGKLRFTPQRGMPTG